MEGKLSKIILKKDETLKLMVLKFAKLLKRKTKRVQISKSAFIQNLKAYSLKRLGAQFFLNMIPVDYLQKARAILRSRSRSRSSQRKSRIKLCLENRHLARRLSSQTK